MKKRIIAVILSATMILGLSGCGNKENEEPTTTVVEESTTVEKDVPEVEEEVAEESLEETEPVKAVIEEDYEPEKESVVEEVVDEVFHSKYPRNFSEIKEEDISKMVSDGIEEITRDTGDNHELKQMYLVGEKGSDIVDIWIVYYTTKSDGRQGYQVVEVSGVEFSDNHALNGTLSKSNAYVTSIETAKDEIFALLYEPVLLDEKTF